MFSWEYNILRTLLRHKAGPLQDTIKIGSTMLLALRWPSGHLDGVHLRPPHLATGEGHAGTFYTDRPLDDVKSRASAYKPLHEPEVAAWNRLGGP